MRFNVLVNGEPVQKHWNNYIEKWFRYLDVNNRGVLNGDELSLAPNDQGMAQLMAQGGQNGGLFIQFGGRGGGGKLNLALMGKNPGDTVSLQEFQAYYRKLLRPVQVVPQVNNDTIYTEAGNVLFKMLDLNGDGKLSKDEVLAACKSLRKLDLDDDEWITLQELTPALSANNNFNQFQIGRQPGMNVQPGNPQINDAFFQVRPGEARLGQVLLERYDRDKVERLTRKELGLDEAMFALLDKNGDGSLDRDELNSWHERPADLEFTIRIGKDAGVVLEKSRQVFLPAVKEAGGIYQVSLEDSQISLVGKNQADPNNIAFIRANQISFYMQQFRQADSKNQGFVELKDLEGQQFQFLRQAFPSLDRDRDGKLTRQEVEAFVELQTGAADTIVTLGVVDQGRAFFQILDANRDGRLSQARTAQCLEPAGSARQGRQGLHHPVRPGPAIPDQHAKEPEQQLWLPGRAQRRHESECTPGGSVPR